MMSKRVFPFSRQWHKVTPIAPPTGCGIRPVPNRNLFWKYGCRLRYTSVRKGHTENNEQLLKALSSLEEHSQFKDRVAHGGGVRSSSQTSAYAQIEKEKKIFWFTENKKSTQNNLIFTIIHIIHVHTTDNVRPKQWPHALSNKLQVLIPMRIYKYSMGFRTPAVWPLILKHLLQPWSKAHLASTPLPSSSFSSPFWRLCRPHFWC